MAKQFMVALLGVFFFVSSHALKLNGHTEFALIVPLNASVEGRVLSVEVKPGQRVKKGDVMIRLDDTAYQARLARSKAVEKSLQPALEKAQIELERAFELYDRDSLSEVELKNAQNNMARAEGEYQAAQADTRFAEFQRKNSKIHSPLTGRILKVHARTGEYINPMVDNHALLSVVDARNMKAVALLDSEQWDKGLLNKSARIIYKERQFKGKVTHVGLSAVSESNASPSYELHINFTSDELIPAQMPVVIEIES